MRRDILLTILLISMMLVSSLLMYTDIGFSSPDQFTLANVEWGSLDNPRKVYPGSNNVLLVIEVINNNNFTLESVVGNLILPHGFTDVNGGNISTATGISYSDDSVVRYVEAGRSFQFTFTLSISENIHPDTYYANLSISYTYRNNSQIMNNTYMIKDVPLKVSDFPSFNIEIKRVEWLVNGEYVNASPGSRGLTLSIELLNNSTESIDTLDAYLNLTYPFYPYLISTSINNIGSREKFRLNFDGIGIYYNASPGIYQVNLTLHYTFRGYGDALEEYNDVITLNVVVGEPNDAGIAFVRAYWQGDNKVYPGSRNVYLNIELENVGRYQIRNLVIKIKLPTGFKNQSGGSLIKTTYSNVIAYGDFFTVSIGPIYVDKDADPGVYNVTLYIDGFADVNGAEITVSQVINGSFILNSYTSKFEVVNVYWEYNGQPAIAYPYTRGITLVIELVYRGEYDISGLDVGLSLPSGFKIKSIHAPTGRIASSTIFRITVDMDIGKNVGPGSYHANINLRYTLSPNNLNAVYTAKVSIGFKISNPEHTDTDLRIASVFWGVNTPRYVYPASQNNPLSIYILNDGGYDVEGVTLTFTSLPEGLRAYPNNITVSNRIVAGSSLGVTAYFNVSKDLAPGKYTVGFNLSYDIRIYGSIIHHVVYKEVEVIISRPIFEKPYLKVYQYGWANDYKVYPGTEDATLTIDMVNDAMYSVSSIHIYISDRDGLKVSNGSNFFYISGPVNTGNTLTINVRLDVDKTVSPGYHELEVKVNYLLDSGGNGYLLNESFIIEVYVSPLKGIEYVMHTWMGTSPGPGSAGVTLLLIYRNNEIDLMKGLYAHIKMPDGFISADEGSSEFNVTPVTASSLSDLMSLLSRGFQGGVLTSVPSSGEIYKGDYIALPIRLIISPNVSVGNYNVNVSFNFLDQWDSIHEVKVESSFRLPGAVGYIDIIEDQSYLKIGEREANVSLTLKNPGDAPIYDVYVGIASYTQTVVFSSSLKHLSIIRPGEKVELSWKASVNPQTTLTGSIPILITVSYVDPIGYRRTLNQTAVVYVVGLASLKIIDLEVNPSPVIVGKEFSVSATIVNVGTDTARYTEVYLEGDSIVTSPDSYSFLGDIDVSYQFPFTVYAKAGNATGINTIYLVIKYYDIYNKEYTIKYPIKITIEEAETKQQEVSPIQGFIEDYWRIVVTIAVIIFLIVAGLMIYRLLRGVKPSGV